MLKKDEKKFIPLRKIAKEGPYSAAYLSILVQRKKLKAKKIGRNYFTTREWFNDYLQMHAREEKLQEVENIFEKKETSLGSSLSSSGENNPKREIENKKEIFLNSSSSKREVEVKKETEILKSSKEDRAEVEKFSDQVLAKTKNNKKIKRSKFGVSLEFFSRLTLTFSAFLFLVHLTFSIFMISEVDEYSFALVSESRVLNNLKNSISERNEILMTKIAKAPEEISFVLSFWVEAYKEDVHPSLVKVFEPAENIWEQGKVLVKQEFSKFYFSADKLAPKNKTGVIAGVSEKKIAQDIKEKDDVWMYIEKELKNFWNKFSDLNKFVFDFLNNHERKVAKNVYEAKKDPKKDEGVVVVPFENDEEAEIIKNRVENMFSDEVEVEPDLTGKAGVVKPVFGANQETDDQEYLYLMVPVNDGS